MRLASVQDVSFPHVRIDNFFSRDDINNILNSREENLGLLRSNSDLQRRTGEVGYVPVRFPGAFTEWEEYLQDQERRRQTIGKDCGKHTASEARGLVLRLAEPISRYMQNLISFWNSGELQHEICRKLGVGGANDVIEGGFRSTLTATRFLHTPTFGRKFLPS